MGPEKRQPDITLKDRLFKEFFRFSFFQAVGLLEKLFPEKKPIGQTLIPEEEAVRFSSKLGFSFSPSDISGIKLDDEEKPVDMEVAFMGLAGPSGVLPHWYNEQAIERELKKNFSLTAFYNMFNHRLISLFYLAWKRYQLSAKYLPGEKDDISSCFLNIAGVGTPGLLKMIGLPRTSLVHFYSGLLSRTIPSACAIEAVVGYVSGTSARVDQFIEQLLPISPEDQTQIGMANGQLGVDTVCGSYVRENRTKFRINLGPMGFDDFLRLMPTGKMLGPIFSIVKFMVGIEYEFDIRIFMKRKEVPSCIPGMDTPGGSLLGWSTWIKNEGVILEDDPCVVFQETDL